jgi:hypothetical protein
VAARLRSRFAAPGEAVDLALIAQDLGCTIKRPGPIGSSKAIEGELMAHSRADRFSLRVDPVPPHRWEELPPSRRSVIARHRIRFRIAHELGHTFYFDRSGSSGPTRSKPWTAREELWCDEFAAALLVSPTAARERPPTADSVFDLQSDFDVSVEVAARALCSAHPGLGLALWFWPSGEPPASSSLLRQWSSLPADSLGVWRDCQLVSDAIGRGSAAGKTPQLGKRGQRLAASVRCDCDRRQVVLVASPRRRRGARCTSSFVP